MEHIGNIAPGREPAAPPDSHPTPDRSATRADGWTAERIRLFLSHLAVDGRVAASTQNVALCALLFLYRDVLQVELPYVEGIERAKRPSPSARRLQPSGDRRLDVIPLRHL